MVISPTKITSAGKKACGSFDLKEHFQFLSDQPLMIILKSNYGTFINATVDAVWQSVK